MKQNFYKVFTVILIVVASVVLFTACVPSSPEKAKANLDQEGYTVTVVKSSDTGSALILMEGESTRLTATKGFLSADGAQYATINYFKTSDSAKVYYDKLKANKEKQDAEQKAKYDKGEITKEQYDNYKSTYKIGRFGKTVWSGTADAIKAAG